MERILDKRKNPTDRRSRIKEVRPSSVDQHRRIWHLVLLNRLPGFTGPFPPPLLIRHICKCYFSVPRSDSFDMIARNLCFVNRIYKNFCVFYTIVALHKNAPQTSKFAVLLHNFIGLPCVRGGVSVADGGVVFTTKIT